MEFSRKSGKVSLSDVNAQSIKTDNLVVNNGGSTFNGDVYYNGNVFGLPETKQTYSKILNLGEPDKVGSWRLCVDENTNSLHIQTLEQDGNWTSKISFE